MEEITILIIAGLFISGCIIFLLGLACYFLEKMTKVFSSIAEMFAKAMGVENP